MNEIEKNPISVISVPENKESDKPESEIRKLDQELARID